jgi:hypothetical protein
MALNNSCHYWQAALTTAKRPSLKIVFPAKRRSFFKAIRLPALRQGSSPRRLWSVAVPEEYFLQKVFFVFNCLLNMIVFDKSPNARCCCLWLIRNAPKWFIFGVIAVSVQRLAAMRHILMRCRCCPPSTRRQLKFQNR